MVEMRGYGYTKFDQFCKSIENIEGKLTKLFLAWILPKNPKIKTKLHSITNPEWLTVERGSGLRTLDGQDFFLKKIFS